jgi:hypothetical protein
MLHLREMSGAVNIGVHVLGFIFDLLNFRFVADWEGNILRQKTH